MKMTRWEVKNGRTHVRPPRPLGPRGPGRPPPVHPLPAGRDREGRPPEARGPPRRVPQALGGARGDPRRAHARRGPAAEGRLIPREALRPVRGAATYGVHLPEILA